MNYKKHYIKLIRKAQNRELLKEVYIEKHHIFPESIYKNSNMIVKLTAKEHFIAHLLLWVYYNKKYSENHWKTQKMMYAFNFMSNNNKYLGKEQKINSRIYQKLKEDFARGMSKFQKEYQNRPEVKEFNKEFQNRPEVKERNREFQNRPEVKERKREFHKEFQNRPEVKERKREVSKHKMRAVKRTNPLTR